MTTFVERVIRRQTINFFRRYGYTTREANWAADNELAPWRIPDLTKRKQILRQMEKRRTFWKILVRQFKLTKMEAAFILENERRERAEDEDNIFQGETP